ncbi:MAG: universal stress protein [Anaeromyxobacteraceae bacterium]
MAELQWKKEFCPVDFSDESRAALRVAVDLARRFGAELTLFHADTAGSALQASVSEPGQLGDWKRQAEALGAPRVTTARAAGEPQATIVEEAQRGGANLIVMGTHGRTGRSASLIGSVAENIVRRSTIPVLTVHADWTGA